MQYLSARSNTFWGDIFKNNFIQQISPVFWTKNMITFL